MIATSIATSQVRPGIDVLRAEGFAPLRGRRIGLMTNPSAVDTRLNSTVDVLWRAREVTLVALFGPEHGVTGTVADGEPVASGIDARTGLPAHSLYGTTYRPTREMLEGVDVLVCDIQDIGARFYTFLWTVSYILEAAGEYGVPVMILDRPNPIGGRAAGPLLMPEVASFVGRHPIPIRHGMTLGELALMFNALWNPFPAHMDVIQCEGWSRHMRWEDTGLPFVPPSPAMPHPVTAKHYPGACLLEGTTLSEGRGTALPFEIVGAPYLDGPVLAERLNVQGWPGVRFRPHIFEPAASKYAGVTCHGVQAHITDEDTYDPILVWLGVISVIRAQYPAHFGWHPAHFDRLIGNRAVREAIDRGVAISELVASWAPEIAAFQEQRRPYLLYE